MVVVVARKDLWKKEYNHVVVFLNGSMGKITSRLLKRKICPQLLSKNCTLTLILWEFWVLKFLVFQISEYLNLL
jgi:hypothetical protein